MLGRTQIRAERVSRILASIMAHKDMRTDSQFSHQEVRKLSIPGRDPYRRDSGKRMTRNSKKRRSNNRGPRDLWLESLLVASSTSLNVL